MDGFNEWNWDAMANGFCPTIDASSSSFAATTSLIPTTPTIPVNNSQMMDDVNDWGLQAMINGFSPNTVASSSSFARASTTTTFKPSVNTAQTIPMNNSQMMGGGFDGGLHETTNELYPSFAASASASASSFSFSFSSSTFSATTAIPITTSANPIPVGNYNQQNSSFSGETLNQHQPMNINNIKQMLENSNYPINVPEIPNPPISNNSLQILSLPNHEKLPKVSKSQQHHQQQYQPPPQNNYLHINQQFVRVSEHAKARAQITTKQSKTKTKRVYKMPVEGLNSDSLSWKKYGAKLIDGSQYPRVYYKCTVTNDCKVRRKVELNRSEPNSLIVTFSGDHNHLPPTFGNPYAGSSSSSSKDSTNHDETNYPSFSTANSPVAMLSFGKKKTQKNKKANKDDDIYAGLDDFVPL